jgi:hypothetical protein
VKLKFNFIEQWDKDGEMTKLVTKGIGQMMCTDLEPFNLVDHVGFRKLMEAVAPLYKLK